MPNNGPSKESTRPKPKNGQETKKSISKRKVSTIIEERGMRYESYFTLYQNFFSGSLQQSSLLQKISKYCNFGAKFFAIMMIIATNDWKSFDIMVVI